MRFIFVSLVFCSFYFVTLFSSFAQCTGCTITITNVNKAFSFDLSGGKKLCVPSGQTFTGSFYGQTTASTVDVCGTWASTSGFIGDATLNFNPGSIINVAVTFNATGTVNFGTTNATFTGMGGSATINITGSITTTGAFSPYGGNLTVSNTGTLNVGGAFNVPGAITNNGTIDITGDMTLSSGSYTSGLNSNLRVRGNLGSNRSITNNGTLQVDGNTSNTPGTASITTGANATTLLKGTLNNAGGTFTNSGTATITGAFNNNTGTIIANKTVTINSTLQNGGGIITLRPNVVVSTTSVPNNGSSVITCPTCTGGYNNCSGIAVKPGGLVPSGLAPPTYACTIGDNACGCYAVFTGGVAPLPVTLLSFKGARGKHSQVDLYWVTKAEISNREFIIMRKTDYTNFEIVGNVKGLGTSNTTNNYNYTDINAPEGLLYYQLNQIDFDGKVNLGLTTSVKSTIANKANCIIRNPITKSELNNKGLILSMLDPELANATINILVTNMKGVSMLSFSSKGSEMNDILFNSLQNFNSGVYTMNVIPEGWQSQQLKLVVID